MSTENGIGTFYYGNDDPRRDGSQVATLYFVVFYLPVIPLGTHRIRKSAITGGSMDIQRLEALPLRWGQIGLTYLKTWIGMPLVLFAPLLLVMLVGKIAPKVLTQGFSRVFIWVWITWFIVMAAYMLGRARRA